MVSISALFSGFSDCTNIIPELLIRDHSRPLWGSSSPHLLLPCSSHTANIPLGLTAVPVPPTGAATWNNESPEQCLGDIIDGPEQWVVVFVAAQVITAADRLVFIHTYTAYIYIFCLHRVGLVFFFIFLSTSAAAEDTVHCVLFVFIEYLPSHLRDERK